VGLAAVHRRLRLPHRHERRRPAIGGAHRHPAVRVRPAQGVATAPTLSYYASADPQAVWQAGAATALFIAGFGAAGYATRRDLSAFARILFWALIGLIVFGIVTIFVQIPNGALIYAVLGLVIFAGLTAFDFQRLRRGQDIRTAPLLAASIFLDILNVFLLLLSLFGGGKD
jgi:FtsH-binding integral membrane protein